jgi:hypothetical protein
VGDPEPVLMAGPSVAPVHVEPVAHDPAALAEHYARSGVADRLALTGHSHQAWPDVALHGQVQAFTDATTHLDEKWDRAMAQADRVRAGLASMLGDDERGRTTLADSTHTLLVRLLSALDLRARPRIVTTDAEFHSARRQLDRLEEVGLRIERVPVGEASTGADDLAARLAERVDGRTAMVLVSKVLFGTARVVPGLAQLAAACRAAGAVLVVDGYHALGALDWSLAEDDLHDAFVLGGGYKYLQQGEGVCFLRWPAGTGLRPVLTGWFAEFGEVHAPRGGGWRTAEVPNASRVHLRPDGALPGRGRAGLLRLPGHDAGVARAVSLRQVGLLSDSFDALGADPALVRRALDGPVEQRAGFLALRTPHAGRAAGGAAGAGRAHRPPRGPAAPRSRAVPARRPARPRRRPAGRGRPHAVNRTRRRSDRTATRARRRVRPGEGGR